jgi:acetyl-CoA acyltransferase
MPTCATGFSETVPATTIDRQCGSSQQGAHFAAQGIMAGAYDLVIAAGVESMTRVPMWSNIPDREAVYGSRFRERYGLGDDGVRREEGEEVVTADEGIRPGTSLEALAALKPVFREDGRLTAGNSSQISDGAGALLIASESAAARLGLRPIARFHSFALAGVDPVEMLSGPIPAARKVLDRAGLDLDDIELAEVNEAFASVPLAWARELSADMGRMNVNGGAIALGHPLGGTGARLMTSLVHEMRRRGARYGLQTMCQGGGMANATILELV